MKPVALLFIVASSAYGATWIPILPTNSAAYFTRDIIYENSRSSVGTGTTPLAPDQIGSRYFYETGLDGATGGLNSTGQYTHTASGAVFQLRPYTGNNVGRTTGNGESLVATFAAGYYDKISVAAAVGGQNAGAHLAWTVTYATGAPTLIEFDVEDWGNNSPADSALFNVARTNTVNGATAVSPDGNYWSAFAYQIDTDETREILSVGFVATPTGRPVNIAPGQPGYIEPGNPGFPAQSPSNNTGGVFIFGFSGLAIPEPSTALLLGGALCFLAVRRRK